jgi:transcriptional regulator with XRE-family HTH domain
MGTKVTGESRAQDGLQVGERMRNMRKGQGLTLKDVADRAGVTQSLVSAIERGQTNPSLETLRRLAQVLSVPIFHFFLEDTLSSQMVVRHGARRVLSLPFSEARYELLCPDFSRSMEMLLTELSPHTCSSPTAVTHDGEEFAFVLKGAVQIDVAGTLYELEEEDSIYYDARCPHRIINPHDVVARVLTATSPARF